MKIAIVGSRKFENYTLFKEKVNECLKEWDVVSSQIVKVVSGGAKGADTLAYKWACENNIIITVYIPDWKAFGKAAGILRNKSIVDDCTHMIAFPTQSGKGTQDSIKRAKRTSKIIKVFWI